MYAYAWYALTRRSEESCFCSVKTASQEKDKRTDLDLWPGEEREQSRSELMRNCPPALR